MTGHAGSADLCCSAYSLGIVREVFGDCPDDDGEGDRQQRAKEKDGNRFDQAHGEHIRAKVVVSRQ